MVKHFETPKEKDTYLSTIRQSALKEVDITANKYIIFKKDLDLHCSHNHPL